MRDTGVGLHRQRWPERFGGSRVLPSALRLVIPVA